MDTGEAVSVTGVVEELGNGPLFSAIDIGLASKVIACRVTKLLAGSEGFLFRNNLCHCPQLLETA